MLAPSGHRNDHRARLDVEGWIWESRTGSAVIAVDVNAGTLAAPTLTAPGCPTSVASSSRVMQGRLSPAPGVYDE